ncbi:MAG: DUF418 domain-containing protein [candidate division Zixibacteria bacterium]|nr:DUF418 domain-containing protein [candidate division Zixibacteria bacterium]
MNDNTTPEFYETAPIKGAERIGSLDLLRGFAVLGILVINIQWFSMPGLTGFNPTIYGDLTGINRIVWTVSHLLGEVKFMTIFSMLFGAGIVLFCQRLEQSNMKPAKIYYRRTLWLLFFGILHAYLFWTGDILVWYSLSGLLAYLFWRLRPGWLVFWSALLLLIGTGIYALFQWSMPYWPQEAFQSNKDMWAPSSEAIQQYLDIYRGGWINQMTDRLPTSLTMHTFIYLIYGLWRTLGIMLAGMALMKWGVLSAQRSKRFFLTVVIVGLTTGFSITGYGIYQNMIHNFAFEYSMFGGTLFNYWGSILVALAYISLIMLWWNSNYGTWCKSALSATGRMAFSCYITQTVICTTLFFGHGFGLFGYVPRWGQFCIVVSIWIIIVLWANIWLKKYRFGPLEWLWRSLTYWKRQPMKL